MNLKSNLLTNIFPTFYFKLEFGSSDLMFDLCLLVHAFISNSKVCSLDVVIHHFVSKGNL